MLTSFHLHKKSSEVSFKTRSTPASLSIQGQDTKHTTVKWPIISSKLTFAETGEPPRILIGKSGVQVKTKMKHLPSYAHVLHKTLNLVISRCCFAEDSKEVYQNLKLTHVQSVCFSSLNQLFCGVVVVVVAVFVV